jgi:hypothetical protein
METVIADLAFLAGAVVAAVQKAWALALAAFGLFLLYIDNAIKGF